MKASESKEGKRTLANISQNAITEYNLIRGENILSWSAFRNLNNFEKQVERFLDLYPYILPMDFFTKARFIRNRAGKHDPKAVIIKRYIEKIAKHNKKTYLDYIGKYPANEENLKKFIFCLVI